MTVSGDGILLRRARLADGARADVRIAGGRITELGDPGRLARDRGEELVDLEDRLLLPAPAEPHAHLDKALTADEVPNPTGDLPGAVDAWHLHRATLTIDEILARARSAAHAALRHGATAIRTHVDVFEDIGLRGVDALLELRRELDGVMDLQICVLTFPLSGAAGAGHRALVREALRRGADLVGGAPHITADPDAEMAAALALAREARRGVDLHTDEHLRSSIDLRGLAALADGFGYPVAASHCVSLGQAPPGTQDEVAALVARAGVAVICCPQTNLHLQGRKHPSATPRGLTAVAALQRAGVTVAAGGDNTQDPFNPFGRGDPLETAALLAVAAHIAPEQAYQCVSAQARAAMGLPAVRIEPGSPAELLVIEAATVREALATATEDRLVIHRGRPVARTRVRRELLSPGHHAEPSGRDPRNMPG